MEEFSVKTDTAEFVVEENKDAASSASLPVPSNETESLEECVREEMRRCVAEHPLWSDEQKQRVSNRLIELFNIAQEKSKKKELSKPRDPDAEKKEQVTALLERTNTQMLATVECRKNYPPKCVEQLVRMGRLECSYYKQVGSGLGAKERMEAAKVKHRAENSEAVESLKKRNKSLVKQIETSANELTELARTTEKLQSNIHSVIDIHATHRKSLHARPVLLHTSKEVPMSLLDCAKKGYDGLDDNDINK